MDRDELFWYNCICNSKVTKRVTMLSDPKVASLKEPLIKTGPEITDEDDFEPPEPTGEQLVSDPRPILQDGIFCKPRSIEQLEKDRQLMLSIVREKEKEYTDQLRRLSLHCSSDDDLVPAKHDIAKDSLPGLMIFQKGFPSDENKVGDKTVDANKNVGRNKSVVGLTDCGEKEENLTDNTMLSLSKNDTTSNGTALECDKSTLGENPMKPSCDGLHTATDENDNDEDPC